MTSTESSAPSAAAGKCPVSHIGEQFGLTHDKITQLTVHLPSNTEITCMMPLSGPFVRQRSV